MQWRFAASRAADEWLPCGQSSGVFASDLLGGRLVDGASAWERVFQLVRPGRERGLSAVARIRQSE